MKLNVNVTSNAVLLDKSETVVADGIFIFDVWYGPGVLTDFPMVRVKNIEHNSQKITRIASPVIHEKTNTVDVCYEILVDDGVNPVKRFQEIHTMRYYFRPEIEYYLQLAGFKLIDNFSANFSESGYNSWTSYFVAKAVN